MKTQTINKDFYQGYSKLQQEFFRVPFPKDFLKFSFFFNASNSKNNSVNYVFSLARYIEENIKTPHLSDVYNHDNFIDFENQCLVIAKERAATKAQYIEKYFQLEDNECLLFLGSGRQMFLTKESFNDFFEKEDQQHLDYLFSEMKYCNVLYLIRRKEDNVYYVMKKIDIESEEITNL